jgi:hypothetical protein
MKPKNIKKCCPNVKYGPLNLATCPKEARRAQVSKAGQDMIAAAAG